MPTERFQFTGEGGHQLAAALDTPDGPVQAYALFAHCFTCGKDVLAAKRIATALAAKGHCGIAFRLYRPRLQRGRICKFDLLFQRRRSRPRCRSFARNPRGARAPDRAQPWRRGNPRRRRANSGCQGGRDHRGALRSRPCHPSVQGSHRGHPQAWRGGGATRRAAVSHQARIPRRHRRTQPDGARRKAAQGAADHAFADRRHGRDRQCHEHFRRGQASQELCVAGGVGSSVIRQARRGLCRRRHRRLGRALYRARRSAARRRRERGTAQRRGARNPQQQVPADRHHRSA